MTQSGQWLERGPWRDEVINVTSQETCSNKDQMSSVSLLSTLQRWSQSLPHLTLTTSPGRHQGSDWYLPFCKLDHFSIGSLRDQPGSPVSQQWSRCWTSTMWLHNQCLSSTCHSLHWQPHHKVISPNLEPWGLTSSPFFFPLFPAADVSLYKQKLGTELKKGNEAGRSRSGMLEL